MKLSTLALKIPLQQYGEHSADNRHFVKGTFFFSVDKSKFWAKKLSKIFCSCFFNAFPLIYYDRAEK